MERKPKPKLKARRPPGWFARTREKPIDDLIDFFGSARIFSNLVGRNRNMPREWRTKGIPFDLCPKIVKLTRWKFKLSDLRPDMFEDWPEDKKP